MFRGNNAAFSIPETPANHKLKMKEIGNLLQKMGKIIKSVLLFSDGVWYNTAMHFHF